MAVVPDHISILLQDASEYDPKIDQACLDQADHPKSEQLKRISVYVGELAHTLRAVLNNAMWDFAEKRLRTTIPGDEYETIRYSHDFPIETNTKKFNHSKERILRYIRNEHKSVYEYLERAQPFHAGNEHLLRIRTLSNDTSHTIPVETKQLDVYDFAFDGGAKLEIRGDRVIVPRPRGLWVAHTIPCYVEEVDIYVSSDKKWIAFLMTTDGKPSFSPRAFSRGGLERINKLLNEFYDLW